MTYAFTFDASACSGCKACQAACKDKNQLPVGVLWRRVYEVSGGGWEKSGDAWKNTVFAYNMSIACNHCEHPKCAGVCPVDAYVIRPDGIVYIDESKCVGCGYCAWACPYGAPQYNPELGHMTKCDFCLDNIDAGLPPTCVAACPMRVLDYKDVKNTSEGYIPLWTKSATEHPFPMSPYSRTEPHLAVKLHVAMKEANGLQRLPSLETPKSGDFGVRIANHEEIHPRKESAWAETPLVIFTLLAQMAAGGFWSMLWMFPPLWNLASGDQIFLRVIPLLVIGILLGIGTFSSFAHLGRKKNAWRVLNHLRKSWLSREILSASLFGAGWLIVTAEIILFQRMTTILLWVAAAFGFYLIHSMSNVYRLPAKPAWDTWRTNVAFMTSALLLGELSMAVVLSFVSQMTGINLPNVHWQAINFSAFALLILQMAITSKCHSDKTMRVFHIGLNLIAMSATIAAFLFSEQLTVWNSLFIFLVVLAEEVMGRWLFYRR